MRIRAIRSSFVLGMLVAASCTLATDDASLSDEASPDMLEDSALGSIQQPVAKGRPGAVNGALDYCNNSASQCTWGEGDCDSNAQCAPGLGLSCVANNGPKFGFPTGWDVCAASHCANKVMDGDETGINCGGSCGTCSSCLGTPGSVTFCLGCSCASGEGDCDSSAECASGLICANDNGPQFGLPDGYDVCVPPHCSNRALDAASGETSVDDGGPCGTRGSCSGTPGSTSFCVGCKCSSGYGDCESNAECSTGLSCGLNNGPNFGLPAAYDVCVPPHCTNRLLDAASGETGVDVGGPCEAGCGNSVVDMTEACDDGINDGILCSADCGTAPEVAQIRWDCDAAAGVITGLHGTQCFSFPGAGASYITFASGGVEVTLYGNGDCTGATKTVTSNLNFCSSSFDQGGGLNDAVHSAMVRRL
jgi:hypothetical protein